MKTQLHSPLALALLALLLALPGLRAASATPPDKMTYQGFLVDANGVALGNTAPVNHTVEFRIYDASTGGTVKWGEVQTVTVDKGYFSVMLGDGSVLGGAPTGPLSAVFQGADASDRFISIKVTSLAGSPGEIVPRLRLVTSPYAYMATTLPPGAITNGLLAAASITGDKLATNTLTAANFSTNVGLWTASGTNIYRTGGNVGIGTTTPNYQLSLGSGIGDKLAVWDGGTGASYGFGIQASLLQIHSDTSGGDIAFGYGNSASFTEKMRIKGSGALSLANGPSGLGGGVGQLATFSSSPGGNLSRLSLGIDSGFVSGDNRIGTAFFNLDTPGINWGNIVFCNSGGKVGIGTTTPLTSLHIPNSGLQIGNHANASFNNHIVSENDGAFGFLKFYNGNWGNGSPLMTMGSWGSVGIGDIYPAQAKLVINGTYGPTSLGPHGFLSTGGAGTSGGAVVNDLSIYASHWVAGAGFRAFSDERIKRIEGRSDAARDLNTLMGIEVTDYRYVDTIGKDNRSHKKVIAQQVERIFPEAVTKTTDVIPDIFKKATLKDGWVQLATDLRAGERVKLIGEREESTHEVLEVKAGAFRTAFKPATEKVFVYGREVKDFRTVDYEAISMLNVSATQELARKVDAQEKELTELRAELAKLRGERKSLAENVSNLEASFARLEKALSKRDGVIEAKATTGDVIGASK